MNLFAVILILLVLLSGCDVAAGRIPDPAQFQAPTASTVELPSATGTSPAVLPTMTPAPTASPTLTPSPTATATPYVCPYLQGRTEIGALESDAMGEQVRFLVHLPPCYDQYPAEAFPVLYLFHGWPLDEWHWDDLGIDEYRDDWISRGLVGPFIIVLPGVGGDGLYVHSSGGDHSFEGFVVNELVPTIDSTYRTLAAPSGRGVGGISRGGVWALEIAMRHPDVFSTVGAHSPALALNQPLPAYDPFLLAEESVEDLRFYLDAGDGDWARASTISFRDLLQSLEGDVVYEVRAGGHVDDLWRGGVPDYITFYAGVWPTSYEALPTWEAPEPTPTPTGAP